MSLLMCVAERTLAEEVPAAPDRVRAFYVDLDNIRLVHPLVVSVRPTTRTPVADGYLQSYRVHDRIPLGIFSLKASYVACLHVRAEGDVIAEARQFPMVRVHSRVTFDRVEGGTRVVERMRITAPRPLAVLTVRKAVEAHIAMLSGIRRWFDIRRG